MTTIEHQLSALQPAKQTELARRILEIPQRRRQRRRDCVVALGGLLSGIAATLLVVITLPARIIEVPVVQIEYIQTHERGGVSPPVADVLVQTHRGANAAPLVRYDADYDFIDLDALIARYEKLLRHRSETANRFVVVTPKIPTTTPDGVSPWEYRKKLLEECTM